MPRSLDEGFSDFLKKLTPSSGESTAAKGHRASIESCLKSDFGLTRFFQSGSFGNATSISGFSDVDYFAVIPTDKLKSNSNSSLTAVRDALDARFPKTGVRVNCPAIHVPFGTEAKESTEVVVADDCGTQKGYKVYDIADCNGGWRKSSPDAHDAYVRQIDEKLNGKVKPLIRFVKAWKYYNSVPIGSFYLEMRVAEYCSGESTIVYRIDLHRFFAKLISNGVAAMQDPMGISGYISGCSTDVQLKETKSKLETAQTRAEKASYAEKDGKTSEAFDWYALLYNKNFPTYYR